MQERLPTLRDARVALRTLTRTPGFTAVVVLTLALGIGASTAIFTVVNAIVLRPLDYPDAHRLVRITSELQGFGAIDTGITAAELADYQARTDLFAGVAGLLPVSANATSGDTPERVEMMLVSWNYFAVLGVPPAHGRAFSQADDVPGVANVAVVSDAFWRRRLGADPQAIGRTIVIDNDPIEVVGVMPPAFRHPGRVLQAGVDVWSPAGFRSASPESSGRSRRRLEGGLARLPPGTTVEQTRARLIDYGAQIARQYPADYPAQNGWRPRIIPLHDDLVGSVATPMFVLLCGVGLLLLISCVNVAHLVLVRSAGRAPEMALRRALGAGGGRLAAQLVVESALLAAAAGAAGILVASWGVRALLALAPPGVPRLAEIAIDSTAILVTALIAIVVTVIVSVGPMLHVRRAGMLERIKEGGARHGAGTRRSRARSLLVVAEVAMATVLLVGAGLLVRTVVALLDVPVGFQTPGLLTARITLPRPNDATQAEYLDPARRVAFARETLRRIEALPGVGRAALSSQIPLGGFNAPLFVEIENDRSLNPVVHHFQVSPGLFDTMEIPIVRGRSFTGADGAGGEPVAVVSETAARQFWGDRNPVGARVRFGSTSPWITVVGVAGDVLHRRLTERPQPILYRPLEQSSDLSLALLIRTRDGATGLRDAVAREIRAVDPNLPVYAVRTMDELLGTAVAQRRFLMRLLVAFGALATTLALIGIYGVMAYSVSQRTREIAIRMAIGARRGDVALMILRGGMVLTAVGLAAGLAASLGLAQFVRSQLFGIEPSDPPTLLAVLALMIVAAAAAAWLPARRAARVDPMTALRAQ
jgi:putative ABC transport system permease protein